MKPFTNPYFHDPMFNTSFSELGFEYDKNGAILTPWSNQFPNPIKYSTKRDIWLRGHQYEFKLFDGKVIVSNSPSSGSWEIYYSHHNIVTEKNMKDLSFNAPKEMDGSLNSINFDITTGVKFQDESGSRPNWGLKLNCIYLELSNESWIYIRKDHPLITNQIDNNKIRNLGIEIYYMCDQPFNWFKINTEDFPIRSDKWFSFWGGKDYRN
jgi:hypothetical protein